MRIHGIDQSNTIVGLATIYRPDGSVGVPTLEALSSMRALGLDEVESTANAVVEWVLGQARAPEVTAVRLEKAPITAREDVHHGPQAAIGWALGLLAGEIRGRLRVHRYADVELVEVSVWRERMVLWANRWGVSCTAPPKEPPAFRPSDRPRRRYVGRGVGKAFLVTWEGCDHSQTIADFDALMKFSSTQCPGCEGSARRDVADPAEWRRREWKKLACRLVAALWPAPYADLVARAAARARTEKEDVDLSGVNDACEAVWIAVSALDLR